MPFIVFGVGAPKTGLCEALFGLSVHGGVVSVSLTQARMRIFCTLILKWDKSSLIVLLGIYTADL